MQLFASATALMRGQILPPSEMKSLYGSTTSNAVMPLSYVGVFMTCLRKGEPAHSYIYSTFQSSGSKLDCGPYRRQKPAMVEHHVSFGSNADMCGATTDVR